MELSKAKQFALKAGLLKWSPDGYGIFPVFPTDARLDAFEALVRADEREACALLCVHLFNQAADADDCAAAIRARSEA